MCVTVCVCARVCVCVCMHVRVCVCVQGEMSVSPACFAHFVNLLKPLAAGRIALLMEVRGTKRSCHSPCPLLYSVGNMKTDMNRLLSHSQ